MGAAVGQRHADGLSLADVDDRPRHAALEAPAVVLHAGSELDGDVFEDHVDVGDLAGRTGGSSAGYGLWAAASSSALSGLAPA